MSLLCGNSSSRSSENSHTIIESLPTSTTLIEDSDSNREEIDIFFRPDDSIPPGIESDFDSEEDIIDNLLNDDPIPEYERLTFDMEPDVHVINNVDELNEDECFDPGGGEINVEVDDTFTFVTRTFLPYLTYLEVRILQITQENGQKPDKHGHENRKECTRAVDLIDERSNGQHKFWKSVKPVINANETIRIMVDRQKITYTVDMLRATLKLQVETPTHPFIAPATLKFIQPFMKIISYQTSVHDQTKINILHIFHAVINRVHVDYASLLWLDFLHRFDSIPKRLKEEYHSIKDDVSLVSVYTTRNVTVKGMLISDVFLTDDIRETQEYKNYVKEFVRIDKKQKSKQVAGEPSTPRKTLKIAEEQENMAAVEEQLLKGGVEKIVEGEDEESYASEFADSVFFDEEDSGTRIDLGSHKENPKTIDDDDVEEKKDDKKDDDDDDDDNDDHDDHALDRNKRTDSSEDRTEKTQTPISSPPRSPRKDLSLDKAISKELTVYVSSTPTPTTSSQRRAKLISKKYSHITGALKRICKRQVFIIKQIEKKYVTNCEFQGIKERVDTVLHEMIPQITSKATNYLIDDNLPRVMADVIIEELFQIHMKNNVITIHHTTSISTVTTTTADLQHQLFVKMKSNLQDQVADPELWDVLKRKFEKSLTASAPYRIDAFHKRDHDDYQEDDAPPEEDIRVKRKNTSKGSKSTSGPQRNPNELPRYLYNKDLFFLKYGNSEERKYALLLHKIHGVPFSE
ncbi:hypothetical protein Tco_0245699 [Tanacetum coccineum]